MPSRTRFFFLLFFALLAFTCAYSQSDSLVMDNGDVMVGEIKKLSMGVLEIETDYSDDDFKIEWNQVKYIKSEQVFLVTLSKGDRYNGTIVSSPAVSGSVIINDINTGETLVKMTDMVFFKAVDQTFLSRLDLLVSLGYTLTKANNSNQFHFKLEAGYLSNTFGANINFNRVSNFQSADDSIKISSYRTEAGASLQFFIVRDWFATIGTDLLQSTEQKLDLRAVTRAGVGNYLVSTQSMYFVMLGGGAWNFENYHDPELEDRNSFEAFLSMEYNIFDLGDLDLKTGVDAYPGLTEWGRFRTDFRFDLRYEFISDFFVNLGFTVNYDNQPVEGASEVDYVFQTTVGWEL